MYLANRLSRNTKSRPRKHEYQQTSGRFYQIVARLTIASKYLVDDNFFLMRRGMDHTFLSTSGYCCDGRIA